MEVEIEVRQPLLKTCPFCGASQSPETVILFDETGEQHEAQRGGSVRLRAKKTDRKGYGLKTSPYMIYWVSCSRCGAKSGYGMEQKNGINGMTVTAEQAERIAIDKWNVRSS